MCGACAAPTALGVLYITDPALTDRANFCRAYGARDLSCSKPKTGDNRNGHHHKHLGGTMSRQHAIVNSAPSGEAQGRIWNSFRRWGCLQVSLDPLGDLQPEAVPGLEVQGKDAEALRRQRQETGRGGERIRYNRRANSR